MTSGVRSEVTKPVRVRATTRAERRAPSYCAALRLRPAVRGAGRTDAEGDRRGRAGRGPFFGGASAAGNPATFVEGYADRTRH